MLQQSQKSPKTKNTFLYLPEIGTNGTIKRVGTEKKQALFPEACLFLKIAVVFGTFLLKCCSK